MSMTERIPPSPAPGPAADWDTDSHEDFFKYYEQQSLSAETFDRFRRTTEFLLRLRGSQARSARLEVLDVGCGAGAQAVLWTERGHRYHGLDINRPLVELARRRAAEHKLDAVFEVGSATTLPWSDGTFDICLLPELLEHVADWQRCVAEATRVLRAGGLIYINTSSKLCPLQQEFNLPLYSWYPGAVKRYFERRAVTDWPSLANYAKYPAVNWFSYYGLRRQLTRCGFDCMDRFDITDRQGLSAARRALLDAVKTLAPARFLGHVMTPYTLIVGRKKS
jgi:ubiquinone/menaquinone biosynthesis C-methylase UbiE